MILVIDNYDSFVYNLARYVCELGFDSTVSRNDAISLADIEALQPSHLIISPGPKTPDEAGISNAAIRRFGARLPVLGVCLGHQCIGHVFGGRVERAHVPMHGKASQIDHDGEGLFRGLPNPLRGGRYHSLVVSPSGLPAELVATAFSPEGDVMALRHRRFPIFGVQFHPESILTEHGHALLRNFLELA
ncbi:MAG: aminodeoxychorismate/anthranilate synthase component II [Chloroflexi bacterium]|nr:aminodeoxychorismate/anthranilate synthase component II [Chloroflexota bacterium]